MSENSDPRHLVTRRDFTVESALALLAGVTITVTGCGDDDDNGTSAPTPPVADVSASSISGNHGHTATITAAQISSPTTISLDIRGTASHPHTVQLTMAQVQAIGARQQVAVTSSTDNNHTHTVTFN